MRRRMLTLVAGAALVLPVVGLRASRAATPGVEYAVFEMTLGGDQSQALAMNARGQVVGWSTLTPGSSIQRAFVWENGEITLLSLPPGVLHTIADDINEAGVIRGRGFSATGVSRGAVWLPLPK